MRQQNIRRHRGYAIDEDLGIDQLQSKPCAKGNGIVFDICGFNLEVFISQIEHIGCAYDFHGESYFWDERKKAFGKYHARYHR